VIVRAGALAAIVSAKSFVPEAPFLSTTCTVKAKALAIVGVPERVPFEEFKERPAGRLPPVTDHVYGAVPPETASVCE